VALPTRSKLFETSLAAALEYAHYIHGVNPLGLVYLDEYDPSWRQSVPQQRCFISGLPTARAGKSDRASFLALPRASWLVDPIRNFQSIRAVRHLLDRGIPLLRWQRHSALPAEFHAAVGAAAGQSYLRTMSSWPGIRGRSQSRLCTTNPTMCGCLPPSPGDTASRLSRPAASPAGSSKLLRFRS